MNRGQRIFKGPPEFVEYIVLPEERIEEAIDVQWDSMHDENVCMSVGVFDSSSTAEPMRKLFREIIKDNYSVVALDTRTDKIISVAMNKIHVQRENGERDPIEEFMENHIEDDGVRAMLDFLSAIESKVNLFRQYDVRCIMEIFYVGTDARFSGCGIGLNVVKASIEHARRMGTSNLAKGTSRDPIAPEVVFATCTSNFSQRIVSRLGFEWLITVPYDHYFHRGRKLSEKIGRTHKTARLGALRLV